MFPIVTLALLAGGPALPLHAALVALVRGLQVATLVTWGTAAVARGESLLRVMFAASRSRWDRQWSSITWFAATQAGFAVQ